MVNRKNYWGKWVMDSETNHNDSRDLCCPPLLEMGSTGTNLPTTAQLQSPGEYRAGQWLVVNIKAYGCVHTVRPYDGFCCGLHENQMPLCESAGSSGGFHYFTSSYICYPAGSYECNESLYRATLRQWTKFCIWSDSLVLQAEIFICGTQYTHNVRYYYS